MKKSILIGILVCLSTVAFAQRSMEWYSYWGSNVAGNQIDPQRMVVDNDGNIYVAALFGGDKVGVESQTLNSKSSADKGDAVIVKISPAKVVLGVYTIVKTGKATVSDLALDSEGNLLVLGAYTGTIQKADGSTMEPSQMYEFGEAAIYVVKLSSDLNLLNAWQIAASDGAKAGGIAIDSQDNVVISGTLDGDAVFVEDAEVEGDMQNSAQLFVAKYAKDGTPIWHQFRNDNGASVYGKASVAVDANDHIYVASSITGSTTFGNAIISATASNAILFAYDAAGVERWYHMIDGDEADVAGALAVSPIGQVVIAVNHHSGDLHIDDMSDVFNNGYAFDAAFAHSAFFAFDLKGEFKWFYDWGYSNGTSGSDAICYGLRCTDEGVWYATGMMTGRYGGSRLPEEIKTLPNGKNSGVETIDNQWLQHNTNGGHDCYLITLTRDGKLANAIRPGGPQYEDGMDVALSPDKKSLYWLMQINVRDQAPYTCPDNIFDSWSDMETYGRKGNYTVLPVFCPENQGTLPAAYGKDYKGIFASSLLIKYAMPQITPDPLPAFAVNEAYSTKLNILNPEGQVTLFGVQKSADVQFDGQTVSGTFEDDNVRFVGVLASDSIALPGEIKYYEYDATTKHSVRSFPRTLRYLTLSTEGSQEGIEELILDKSNRRVGRKIVLDGILYIERNGKLYNAQGAQVR